MITAEFCYEDENVVSYEISGHAFSAEPGHDLVCAGVSSIVFGLTNAVISLGYDELDIEMDDGYFCVRGISEDSKVQAIVYGLIVSLNTIEEDNSAYLTVIYDR